MTAQVYVAGTELGATTDQDGRYLIQNVPPGEREVRVRLLGYGDRSQTVTVPAEGTLAVNFELATQAIALDAVLVTGTAGRRERRAQGATIANVSMAQLADVAGVTDVGEVLQARLPGVSLTQGSGVAGSGHQIRIRGASSISLSNEPLVYVDGIRVDTRLTGIAAGATISPLNDLSPAEIESIEIVKGPAAATLYGADASAGVIQVITKRGAAGTRFRQTFSLAYNRLDPNFTPYENFGVCRAVDLTVQNGICQGKTVGTVVSDRPMERYGLPADGDHVVFSWTARGGGERYGFFSAIGVDRENGLFPNSEY
jgi:TonB-dependent SusC/RagA subfamily outer membrane receptor